MPPQAPSRPVHNRRDSASGIPSARSENRSRHTASSPKPAPPQNRHAGSSNTAPEGNPPTSRGVPDDYQIGAGDVLHVYVWKQPDVSLPSVVVRPDGRITVPLIKDVEVGGWTPRQAEKVIAEQLAQFIVGVDVTVVVTAINSKKIYILGGVKKEGTIPYTYRMTVLQALSEAGGLTDYAKRKKIYVLRTEKGKDYRLTVQLRRRHQGREDGTECRVAARGPTRYSALTHPMEPSLSLWKGELSRMFLLLSGPGSAGFLRLVVCRRGGRGTGIRFRISCVGSTRHAPERHQPGAGRRTIFTFRGCAGCTGRANAPVHLRYPQLPCAGVAGRAVVSDRRSADPGAWPTRAAIYQAARYRPQRVQCAAGPGGGFRTGNLYVADFGNNRVLRFPSPFENSRAEPDAVYGQENFTVGAAGTTRNSLNGPRGCRV